MDAAEVPKGSFYTYFRSKEDFALAALERARNLGCTSSECAAATASAHVRLYQADLERQLEALDAGAEPLPVHHLEAAREAIQDADVEGASAAIMAAITLPVEELEPIVDETLAHNNMEKHDLDWLIPHQANLRIIKATARKLDMPMDRVVVTVDKHGNTSAASVPMALDVAVRSGRIKRGDTMLLEAFGGGFTWGAALIKY